MRRNGHPSLCGHEQTLVEPTEFSLKQTAEGTSSVSKSAVNPMPRRLARRRRLAECNPNWHPVRAYNESG